MGNVSLEDCAELLTQKKPIDPASFGESFDEEEDFDSSEEFVFESERLARFANLFGIQHALVAYRDFELPNSVPDHESFVHIPDDSASKAIAAKQAAEVRNKFSELRAQKKLLSELDPPEETGFHKAYLFFDPNDGSAYLQWQTTRWDSDASNLFQLLQPGFESLTASSYQPEQEIWNHSFNSFGTRVAFIHGRTSPLVQILNWANKEALSQFRINRLPHRCDFAGDDLIYLTSEDGIASHDLTGTKLNFWNIGLLRTSVLHPSGSYIVAASAAGKLHIVATSKLDDVVTLGDDPPDPMSAINQLTQMFTQDPTQFEAPEGMTPAQLQTWTMQTTGKLNAQIFRDTNPEHYTSLLFSDDGVWFFAASDRGVRVWNWETLVSASNLPKPDFAVDAGPSEWLSGASRCSAIAYDQMRNYLYFAGFEGIVERLDLKSGTVKTVIEPPERLAVSSISISPDGKYLAVVSNELKINSRRSAELKLWDISA